MFDVVITLTSLHYKMNQSSKRNIQIQSQSTIYPEEIDPNVAQNNKLKPQPHFNLTDNKNYFKLDMTPRHWRENIIPFFFLGVAILLLSIFIIRQRTPFEDPNNPFWHRVWFFTFVIVLKCSYIGFLYSIRQFFFLLITFLSFVVVLFLL